MYQRVHCNHRATCSVFCSTWGSDAQTVVRENLDDIIEIQTLVPGKRLDGESGKEEE